VAVEGKINPQLRAAGERNEAVDWLGRLMSPPKAGCVEACVLLSGLRRHRYGPLISWTCSVPVAHFGFGYIHAGSIRIEKRMTGNDRLV
jgi:hypothetical protein